MAETHVLMLGWEFPPLINGGLGVACHGLAGALSKHLPLTLVLPQNQPASTLALPDTASRGPLSPDLSIPTELTPYLDAVPGNSLTLYGPDLPARVLDFARRAADAAENHSFDLIHAHDWMTALAGLEIRARTGKPLVFQVHSLTYDRAGPHDRSWIHQIEKSALQQADLVVAVSHYTRNICLNHYAADPRKTTVVHNGASPLRPYRSAKPFSEKLVVFLGRLTDQKAPDRFIEIARLVLAKNPCVRFAVAGTGEQLRPLLATTVRLGIRPHFHFTGFLNRQKVHHLFSMADAYCMPSNSEPFGLSALEAAQFGLPVVLSKQSGVSEILPSARLADAADPRQFAKHLIEILTNDQPQKPPTVRSWDQAAKDLIGHYRRILNEANSCPSSPPAG